ncbi:hypothetical protein [Stakelama tenebrarum]|uniref:Uncharacterized protein n=1 Tax=Stakelama tenebrarum TaxID=2711215 RepID=A0A6G6Y7Z7_9SPHN|nr:hypothetical protein [Sphingosinithalassobacter tenebrarum]QIG81040.1 hypothetical protein G5C33_15450 [Sphingosinithalassobacter tenebrarum]
MSALPQGFETLEPFVDQWAVAGSAERAARRDASTAEARETFYAAASPLLTSALDRLDGRPLAEHDASETRLMQLMLSLAHVALAVELQQDDEPKHQPLRREMRITRTPAD